MGDIIDMAERRWLDLPEPIAHFQPDLDDLHVINLLRVGQCWQVEGRFDDLIFEIISIIDGLANVRLWRFDARRADRIGLVSHHSGPHSLEELFGDAREATRWYTYGDKLERVSRRTIREPWRRSVQPVPTPPPTAPTPVIDGIVASIRAAFLDRPVIIFTDGTWADQAAPTMQAFQLTPRIRGGCSLVVIEDCDDWRQRQILAFTVGDDGTSPTDSAYTWELLALATATRVSRSLPLCSIFSDCKSAVETIKSASPGAALLDQHSAFLYPVAIGDKPSIEWTESHPERRDATRRTWSRNDWGIFLADWAASSSPTPRIDDGLRITREAMTSSAILKDFMSLGTWSWVHANGVPVLRPIVKIWEDQQLRDYLQHRDDHHRDPDAVNWLPRSWALTAQVHRFSAQSSTSKARLQRIVFNWAGLGANLYRDDPRGAQAQCSCCRTPETQKHVFSACADPAIAAVRAKTLRAAALYVASIGPQHPGQEMLMSLHEAVVNHADGHVLFVGSVTERLVSSLPPLATLSNTHGSASKAVKKYLRILAAGGIEMIDAARQRRRQEAAAADLLNRPRPDGRRGPLVAPRPPAQRAPSRPSRPAPAQPARSRRSRPSATQPRKKRRASDAPASARSVQAQAAVTALVSGNRVLADFFAPSPGAVCPANREPSSRPAATTRSVSQPPPRALPAAERPSGTRPLTG